MSRNYARFDKKIIIQTKGLKLQSHFNVKQIEKLSIMIDDAKEKNLVIINVIL